MNPQTLQMTDEEYHLINDLISQQIGLTFPPHKKEILESRIRPRVLEKGFSHFGDYYLTLMHSPNGEIQYLANTLTNHESYFFRQTDQFTALFEHGVDELKKSGCADGKISILSAGCASGEEPYSLNILCRGHRHRFQGEPMEIDAFDIDSESLSAAKEAEYTSGSMRTVDEEAVSRYFTISGQADDKRYSLKAAYRQNVRFWKGNILDISSYLQRAHYDVVFCRNVLIYFSEAALHRSVKNFAASLRPGGLLFLGHSESIIGLSKSFEAIRLGNGIVYMRV